MIDIDMTEHCCAQGHVYNLFNTHFLLSDKMDSSNMADCLKSSKPWDSCFWSKYLNTNKQAQ